MKIYIAYKLGGRDFEDLKEKLMEIDKVVKETEHETFIFVRDEQEWIPGGKPEEIMKKAFENLRKCDLLLAIVETQEKGEGMLLESGYAKALGKKVIVASRLGGRAILLKAMADKAFEFKDMKEFKIKLKSILEKIS